MPTTYSTTRSVTSLVGELLRHPVNHNAFFQRFRDDYLDRQQLQYWFRQYHYFCKHFVKALEGLLYATPVDQLTMRVELAKTLHSELGIGSVEQAHVVQLERFGASIGVVPAILQDTNPLPEVRRYLDTLERLFMKSEYLTALGAELAVEITAVSEFQYLYPGLKKYKAFTAEDLAFFELHMTEEQHHSEWLLLAVRHTARTPDDFIKVCQGARETVDAWQDFWSGMHRAVFGSS